jgi:poly(3-hydroxybutyrate) depolymerase
MALAVGVAAIGGTLRAGELGTGFQDRTYRDETGDHKYIVFVPAAYTPLEKWPLLLFLHGSGERGDLRLAVIGGIGPQIKARAETFPFIVVFPPCEDHDCHASLGWRADGPDAQRALKIVDQVERDYSVDRSREVITGLSMGGIGAWAIAAATPSRWSAVVPVASRGDLSTAPKLAHTPIWAFHGEKDVLIAPSEPKQMVNAVNAAGGRAYFTLLPKLRHNILYAVYNDDALYQWMLHPQTEPRPESFVENAKRPPNMSAPGHDFQQPFVPGVEIPQGILVQMDSETIGAIAETVPDLVPAEALSGRGSNISQTRPGLIGPFQITLSGISYHGTLERVVIVPRDNGWISVAMGLRNVTAEIDSSEVRGRLVAANAGRMEIIAGQYAPLWLRFEVRPVIADRRLHFEVGAREFKIPGSDFYVTTPEVTGHGIPIIRQRFSSAVSTNLVNGAYGRKSEMEQRVLDSIPTIVQRLNSGVEAKLSGTRVMGTCPSPALQPRFQTWPESVRVDHSGVSLVLGVVVAQPGVYSVQRPVRRIEHDSIDLETLPTRRGLTFGFSSALLEGLTASVIDVGAAEMSASDFPIKEFDAFQEAATITKALPDLARYGDNLRIRARLRALEPVTLRQTENGPLERVASTGERPLNYQVRVPHIAFLFDIKTSPTQSEWLPCARFDLSLTQDLKGTVKQPDFARRIFNLSRCAPAQITAQGSYVESYQALDTNLHPDVIAELFRDAWKFSQKNNLLEGMPLPDRAIGNANLRLADVDNIGHFIAMRYVPAATRITNGTSAPIAYMVRSPHSEWGGPYTLAPHQSHDFSLNSPLTLRSVVRNRELVEALPMGTHFVFGKNDQPAPTSEASALGEAQTLRN